MSNRRTLRTIHGGRLVRTETVLGPMQRYLTPRRQPGPRIPHYQYNQPATPPKASYPLSRTRGDR